MTRGHFLFAAFAASALVLTSGCKTPGRVEPTPDVDPQLSINTLLDAPDDFALRRIGSDEYPVPPFARYLKDVRICLNPGHGGDAHKRGFKRGPTGVREAEMNLRVALYLRDLLESVGADVRMTREDDTLVSYEDRAATANEWPADLFVCLHHNAIDNKPEVNYTTVWYHARVDYRPSNLDLARYLSDGLHDALALPRFVDVPLKSDQLMYEQGFAVLRHANVTAALCETSFFTNPEEEQRLRDSAYNLREAHGVFIALAKYAAAGLPSARLIDSSEANQNPERQRAGQVQYPERQRAGNAGARIPSRTHVFFDLDDGLRSRKAWGHARQMILTDTIAVRIDGEPVPFDFTDDGERYLLEVALPANLAPGEHGVEVHFQNMNKNSNLNPHFTIETQ